MDIKDLKELYEQLYHFKFVYGLDKRGDGLLGRIKSILKDKALEDFIKRS